MEILIAAISLGFLGSFHCIGMCGPIALSLPVHKLPVTRRILSVLSYNGGRVLTYSILGLIFGLVGQSFSFFGFQQKLSILLGALILLLLIGGKLVPLNSQKSGPFKRVFQYVREKLSTLFHQKEKRSYFLIGLLNGLLPCGLVYMAIAGAVATGSALNGILFMAIFGMGTLPFMMSISFTSHFFSSKVKSVIRKAVPVCVGFMAVLLILRGLNLGIAYVSPKINNNTENSQQCNTQLDCCHKK